MLNKLKNYDFIITLGFYNPTLLAKCDICFYPFLDCETDFYVRYEVGTEEGVVALFLYEFANKSADFKLKDFINALDYGYLSAETNVSEEEFAEIKSLIHTHKNPLLLVGSDILAHSHKANILNMLSALKAHSTLNILVEGDSAEILLNSDSLPQYYTLQSPQNLPEHNGCVIFVDYLNSDLGKDSRDLAKDSQDSQDSAKDSQNSKRIATLKISREFARAWRLSDKQKIKFSVDSQEMYAICDLDENFSGVIGILRGAKGLKQSYPFKNIIIHTGN